MTQMCKLLKVGMVTQPHPFLKSWWEKMNECDKRDVQRHIGYLPSLMKMEAWPDLIDTMVKFWDSDCMVFRFGNVELTPTLEEVLASYESIGMCNKRKSQPNDDILIPKAWDPIEIKEALSSVNIEWISRHKETNIPFQKLYYRFGRTNGYEKFKEEFTSKRDWEKKRPFVFAVCLLGTMVFPQNRKYVIHPNMIMVTHVIFNGAKHRGLTRYYTLVPMILADIYRALDRYRNGSEFFQGCNLILQWWMMKHLLKTHSPTESDLTRRSDQFASHSWWLHFNHFKVKKGQQFWMTILRGLREEDVQWSIDGIVISDIAIRSKKLPFLVLPGLKGTRPYAPGRVLRQFGCRQDIIQTEDMGKFATEHKDGRVSFASMMVREWKHRSGIKVNVSDQHHSESSDMYRDWLKKTLAGTVKPGPNTPGYIKDFEAEKHVLLHQFQEGHQHQHSKDTKTIERFTEELSRARECIVELDDHMEQQTWAMEKASNEEKVGLARDYLQENRYFIWHEVEAAKRVKISAEDVAA